MTPHHSSPAPATNLIPTNITYHTSPVPFPLPISYHIHDSIHPISFNDPKRKGNGGGGGFKAALLSGPPGIGEYSCDVALFSFAVALRCVPMQNHANNIYLTCIRLQTSNTYERKNHHGNPGCQRIQLRRARTQGCAQQKNAESSPL